MGTMPQPAQLSASPRFHHSDILKKRAFLIWMLAIVGLCSLFFVLDAWQKTSIQSTTIISTVTSMDCKFYGRCQDKVNSAAIDIAAHHFSEDDGIFTEQLEPSMVIFPACDMTYSEYTPCQDKQRSLKYERDRLIYRERHCPSKGEDLYCLIPAPPGYKSPFPWPKSREWAWYANVLHKELTVEKAIQNWIQYEGDKFHFPGGGTMFPLGADAYIDDINDLIPLTDGSIRTALDTGCGVASWGAYLLDRSILTMSFAPRDTHEAQVQFALERGVPAMLGIMASQRLPYPARAFDMAHCSRCLIPWRDYDGIYLLEVDRVLRPGGYWILSGPPINWQTHWRGWERTKQDLKEEQADIETLAKRICWKKITQKGNLAIWQKPWNHVDCFKTKKVSKIPPMCKDGDADGAWYKRMDACITRLPAATDRKEVAGGPLKKWPQRLFAVPPRILNGTLPGVTASTLQEDTAQWRRTVSYYESSLLPPLAQDRWRNIVDMNAGFGGFAAALVKHKVWVMNVVPPTATSNTLGVIYERGLIGTYHDWCEAFSTYPRTYDLIHADGVFSMYQDRCEIANILLEMDRILRPEGAIIARDHADVLNKVARLAPGLRWDVKLADHESRAFNTQKILIAVKKYWVGVELNSTELT